MDFFRPLPRSVKSGTLAMVLLVWLLFTSTCVFAGLDYNLDNFPDADQKLEELLAGDEDKQPYYVWRDAQGMLQTTPYNAQGKSTSAAAKQSMDQDSRWSQALDRVRQHHNTDPTGIQADPQALALMGLSGSGDLLADFARHCCQQLKLSNRRSLPLDRVQGVSIMPNSPVHEFVTGSSHYFMLALPGNSEPWALRLRTFIDEGVFLPTLVFLDAEQKPVRMVTDIVFRHEAARWHRLGYLEAVLPMAQEQPEESHYLLVLTQAKDLTTQTRVRNEKTGAERWLNHLSSGEMELKLFSR